MAENKEQSMNLQDIDKMVQGQEVDPETQQQIDAYLMALTQVVHSDETNGSIVEMLKSGPPEQSIPYAAMNANGMVEGSLNKSGVKPKNEVKMAGMLYLSADLAELGNVSGAWETPVNDEGVVQAFQETLKQYIHKGLKDGTIDPVELQAQGETLLNEDQQKVGIMSAQALDLPPSPTAEMGIDEYARRKQAPLEEENKKLKGMLAQQQQVAPQQGGQGGF